MSSSEILHLPIPYFAEFVQHGRRKLETKALRTNATMSIRRVDAQDAPVCIEVRWPRNHVPAEMTWHQFEGAFWRPLLGPDEAILRTLKEFTAVAGHSETRWWRDYPFLTDDQAPIAGYGPFSLPNVLPNRCRVLRDGRNAAADDAQRLAHNDLIIIGDALCRRSAPPVFGVGDPLDVTGSVSVRLTTPEFCPDASIAYFGLDRKDCAIGLARRLAAGAEAYLPGRARRRISLRSLNNTQWTLHRPATFPDQRAGSFQRTFNHLGCALRNASHGELPPRFHEAYGRLSEASRQLLEGQSRQIRRDLIGEALEAVEVIIQTTPPGGPFHRWTRRLKMNALAQKWRFEIEGADVEEDEADDSVDTEVLSALQPDAT